MSDATDARLYTHLAGGSACDWPWTITVLSQDYKYTARHLWQ